MFKWLLIFLIIPSIAFGWSFSADFDSGTLGQPAEGVSGISEANEEGSTRNQFSNTQAHSGTQSMRNEFVQGDTGSPGSANAVGGHISYTSPVGDGGELWGRFYLYLPADFSWDDYDGTGHVVKVFRLAHPGDAGYISIFAHENGNILLSNEVDGEGNHERTTGVPFTLGGWQCLEIYISFNDTAGIVRIWKDGVLIREETNYRTLVSSAHTSTEALVWTYWNGGAPVNQFAWVDDIVVTTDQPTNQDASANYMIGPTDWGSDTTSSISGGTFTGRIQ